MIRFRQAVFVLVLVAAGLAAGYQPGQCRTYRVGTVPWIGWAPLHVAEEKGLWKELGLDVEVVTYADGVMMHDALIIGDLDFAMNMAANCFWLQGHGIPVSILGAVNWSHGGDMVLLKKGADLEDSVGKPLGVYVDYGALHYFLHQYLQSRNMTLEQFRVVSMPPLDLVDQFILGRVGAVVLFDPFARRAAELGGGIPVASSADFPGVIPEVIYGPATIVEKVPEADIVALLRGWIRAVRWMRDPANRDEVYEIINEHTFAGIAAFSKPEISGFLDSVVIFSARRLAEYNLEKSGFPAFLTKAARLMHRIGKADAVYTADDMFRPRYLRKALELEEVDGGR